MVGATSNCHIIAVPYPGRGHINPMLNLCRVILNYRPDILVSFVVTEEWLGLLAGTPPPPTPNFKFTTIPNVLPSEIGRAKDFAGFFRAALTIMEAPVDQLLDRLQPPKPSVIIYDTFLSWVVAVGNRKNIPVASFFTQSATVFSICYHSDMFLQRDDWSSNISDEHGKQQVINYIPSVPPLRIIDIPTQLHGKGQEVLSISLDAIHLSKKAQYVIFTSIYELESQVIGALKQILPPKIYTLGLAIPHLNVENPGPTTEEKPHYLKWLDAQPQDTVLYISQGSFLSVSNDQLDRIIGGVRASGARFLWVARQEADRIRAKCGGNGLVVTWCDQLKVLSHPSVGGFWSHCGWNSTKEGAYAGIPMLTLPIFWDQPTNSKMIVDDWKMGLRVKKDEGECFVTEEEIAGLVVRIMDGESEEGKERRRRAKEIKEICRKAYSKGGSADMDIMAFIRDVSGC